MTLHIVDTLTGEKRPFKPLDGNKVRMYVCGLTVYDDVHLGHARMLVVFDLVARWLRASGYELTYVRNITDIDDKIIKRADELGIDYDALTERYIQANQEDFDALGLLRPDIEPRATQSMDAIIAMITALIERGHAYEGGNGDVYYAVSSFDGYGRLSGERLEDLRAGARIDINEAKTDPADFTLWKAARKGEPSWDSPWGKGRPGWHIECSAMSTQCLGNHFDIHGGGMDLKFPHHENEIAQSVGATGEAFAETWIHNGFLQVDSEKMSKSLGNFFTVREILERYRAEEVRTLISMSHYRSPLSFSDKALDGARAALTRLYTALRGLPDGEPPAESPYRDRFKAAMDDDFNTPVAFAVLFDLAREVNRLRDAATERAAAHAALLRELGATLGLLGGDPDAYLRDGDGDAERIERLIAEREAARARKDFAESDRIRDELKAAGVVLEDGPGGTIWRRGRHNRGA